MVKLCVEKLELNHTMLEWLLVKNNIPFIMCDNAPECGIPYPYLLVDGVPLDLERAIKWIEGLDKHE